MQSRVAQYNLAGHMRGLHTHGVDTTAQRKLHSEFQFTLFTKYYKELGQCSLAGRLRNLGSIPGRVSSPKCPDRLWSQSSVLSNGYRKFFRRRKVAEVQSDHSHPSSKEVKIECSSTPTSPYAFMVCLSLPDITGVIKLTMGWMGGQKTWERQK